MNQILTGNGVLPFKESSAQQRNIGRPLFVIPNATYVDPDLITCRLLQWWGDTYHDGRKRGKRIL